MNRIIFDEFYDLVSVHAWAREFLVVFTKVIFVENRYDSISNA